MVCLSHGSNDVSNAICPLLILMGLNNIKNIYSFILGGVGIGFGLIIYGEKVMKTIGKKIMVLDYFKGLLQKYLLQPLYVFHQFSEFQSVLIIACLVLFLEYF